MKKPLQKKGGMWMKPVYIKVSDLWIGKNLRERRDSKNSERRESHYSVKPKKTGTWVIAGIPNLHVCLLQDTSMQMSYNNASFVHESL